MSEKATPAAAPEAKKGKKQKAPADKQAKKQKGGGKAVFIIVIALLAGITAYESYLLFGGNNLQATMAVITQGRSFLDIADEELLRQKQNVADQQSDLDQREQELIAVKNTLDKKEKALNKLSEELDAKSADLDNREQAIARPQVELEETIKMFELMEESQAATLIVELSVSDQDKAVAVLRGLKLNKRAGILATMDKTTAAKFIALLQS